MDTANAESKEEGAGVAGAASTANAAVQLPENCTIREIAVLHECLRSAPPQAQFDGTAVQRIDSAGLQLLVAFARERNSARAALQWQGVSAAISDAAAVLGVATAINLPAVS